MHPLNQWLIDNLLTANKFARQIHVAPSTITRILKGGNASFPVIHKIETATSGKVTRHELHTQAYLYWPSHSTKFDLEAAPPPKAVKPRGKVATVISQDFTVSENVRSWARQKGYTEFYIYKCVEPYRDWAISKGHRYVDWDASFKKCIRENWFNLPLSKESDDLPF